LHAKARGICDESGDFLLANLPAVRPSEYALCFKDLPISRSKPEDFGKLANGSSLRSMKLLGRIRISAHPLTAAGQKVTEAFCEQSAPLKDICSTAKEAFILFSIIVWARKIALDKMTSVAKWNALFGLQKLVQAERDATETANVDLSIAEDEFLRLHARRRGVGHVAAANSNAAAAAAVGGEESEENVAALNAGLEAFMS
jgi:hypothetical protein